MSNSKPSVLYTETNDHILIAVDKYALKGTIKDLIDHTSTSLETVNSCGIATHPSSRETDNASFLAEISEKGKCKSKENVERYDIEEIVQDDTYYLDMVTFELQDSFFLVPQYRFTQETDAFSILFSSARKNAVGSQLELNVIAGSDFAALMKYLYPLEDESLSSITRIEWVSILQLSTEWKMLDIRVTAIKRLSDPLLSAPSDKIQLGKAHNIPTLLKSGYTECIQRREPLAKEDVEKIGLESAIKLSNILEDLYEMHWDSYVNRFSLDAHGMSNVVTDLFGSDISDPTYDDDPVSQLIHARNHNSKALFLYACRLLSERRESLTREEIEKLPLDTTVRVWKARFEARKAAWSLTQTVVSGVSNGPLLTVEQRVTRAFGEEISEVERQSEAYAKSSLRHTVTSPPTTLPPPVSPTPVPSASGSIFGSGSPFNFGEPGILPLRAASPCTGPARAASPLSTSSGRTTPPSTTSIARGIWNKRGGKAKK